MASTDTIQNTTSVPAGSKARLLSRFFQSGYTWLFCAAIFLRGVYLLQALQTNELLTWPVVDARVYVDWAHEIHAGKWLWYDARTYTPGVPLWLAGWFAVFGERTVVHFAGFLLLGAIQAVLLGKTAELVWNRRVGLATGWLAALYWPLIIFEASYYAEPLAIFSFTLTLHLIVRWWITNGGIRLLLWAGFALGWAILARANTMLVAPFLAGWVAWVALQRCGAHRWRRAFLSVTLLAVPSLSICAPIVLWNYHVNGVAELRTGGWLSVYLGNRPEYRALVVPVGVRWSDFVYLPIRAGQIERAAQNEYWREETLKVIRERPSEWAALMARKAMMLTGSFEVSQEIDISEFRRSSPLLALPVWPGWALVFPLSIAALICMVCRKEARRGLAFAVCAAAYLLSVSPVQSASRYRLPVVVPLLPLAGWMLAQLLQRRPDFRALAPPAAVAFGAGVLVWPDWLGLAQEKIINHQFLVGLKHSEIGNEALAEAAFLKGAAWNPSDPDCPYQLGEIMLRKGDTAKAEDFFKASLGVFPRCYEAKLGLAKTALARGDNQGALDRIAEVMALAPNNANALRVQLRAQTSLGDWKAVVATCEALRGYPTFPLSVVFAEARALTFLGRQGDALAILDSTVGLPFLTVADRSHAMFVAGLACWRIPGQRAGALARWNALASGPAGYFQMLARLATGKASTKEIESAIGGREEVHFSYAQAIAAIQRGDVNEARTQIEAVAARRNAKDLPEKDRELLEIWALEDLRFAPGK
jgi:tetratricopeptide (TPR) repeat protein